MTAVSAAPLVESDPTFPGSAATGTSPSVQFSNNEAIAGPTALSGPRITDFATFSPDGVSRQVLITAGYFWRF